MRSKTNRQIVHFNQLKHSAGDFSRSCHSGEASLLEREENQQTQPTSSAMMQPDITELPQALTATLHGITGQQQPSSPFYDQYYERKITSDLQLTIRFNILSYLCSKS